MLSPVNRWGRTPSMNGDLTIEANKFKLSSPVVIGGVGGSGTRVLARIIRDLGFYIGRDLNNALDNLWFTLLFKRPHWYFERARHSPAEIQRGLRVFTHVMTSARRLSFDQMKFVLDATQDFVRHGPAEKHLRFHLWPLLRTGTMLHPMKRAPDTAFGWGWKEPNSHIYLEHLAEKFPNLRFIHLMRHGLDMALSDNQQQLTNWGELFGVRGDGQQRETCCRLSLEYWVKANERVAEIGTQLGTQRYLRMCFEELCVSPKRPILKLLDFLGVAYKKNDVDRLCAIPRLPSSVGRYRSTNLNIFRADDIDAVRRFGYSLDA